MFHKLVLQTNEIFNTRREFGVPKQPCNALFIVQTAMKCETILVQHFLKSECRDYRDNQIIAVVIFLHVKIKCNSGMTFSCFRLKAHLVFHWCLCDNMSPIIIIIV